LRPAPPLLALLLAMALASWACEPVDRRPGLWLSGPVVEGPIEDWRFSDRVQEIFVESRPWWGLPHSVTTVCAAADGALYVPSLFREGPGFPEGKRWTRNVVRDPRLRLKIDGRIYERRAVLVTDPEEQRRALSAFAGKYPFWAQLEAADPDERPEFVFLRMDPRDERR
jgi:hypothetical protein